MPTRAAVALLVALLGVVPGTIRAETPAPVALGGSIGIEIDPGEREAYGLFPDATGFQSARIYPRGAGYRLEYVERGATGRDRTLSRRVSRDVFDRTLWHVGLTDAYRAEGEGPGEHSLGEAGWLRRLALRYASLRRYEAGAVLVQDLRSSFPGTAEGAWAEEAAPRFDALATRRGALIWPGTLLDQRGRSDLLVFSGYYGLWLGIATPAAFGADDKESYAAGMMLVPAASVLTASIATRSTPISKGTATIIALGGHLGTWQGLGWAGMGDSDGEAVLAAGVLAGLGGIAAAIPMARAVNFTEGQAEIMTSAMYWGGWFGAVAGVLANHDDTQENGVLSDMLIGSDASVLAAGVAARGARVSDGRVRLINLCGVVGGVFGMGLSLLSDEGSQGTFMALTGGGSAAGLLFGANATRGSDRGRDLSSRQPAAEAAVASAGPRPGPTFSFRPSPPRRAGPGREGAPPGLALRVTF